jgi:hypothetical protein
LPLKAGELPVFNLAAPDSPRWNEYFVDLALALGATPVRRLGRRRLQLDAWLAGPPLKMLHRAFKYAGLPCAQLPDPMPPSLLRLWSQHIHLDATQASQQLGLAWTPYAQGLQSSAAWLGGGDESCAPVRGKTACTH